ncbi:carboxymuconolactone decarboxylase family protein [Salininema proteolyticum]|uniref:Carboxymuconolactone decarboxylase family protein n=1 Tax=Salininema proteolyticum TaxID=1607685 RepID=A0ABV8U351_9ACTN
MEPRMKHPAFVLPETQSAVNGLVKVINSTDVPESTLELVHMRASQINGCAACVDFGVQKAKKNGESDERLHSVAVWRESPLFTEAERAALALTESATRIADRPDSVSDEVWDAAAGNFNEEQLSAILLMIGMTNLANRLNVPIRLPAGQAL